MIRTIRAFGKKAIPEAWQPLTMTENWIAARAQKRVVTGPFQGMLYVDTSVGSHYYPKLLGTYEKELHSLIRELSRACFEQIVNIGSGEGYYAVGLARLNPKAQLTAFETQETGQALICSLAQLNGVENQVNVKGTCDEGELRVLLEQASNSLIIVDIEGGERELLDPTRIVELKDATMVVEIHNALVPNTDQTLLERFEQTHIIREIPAVQRSIADFPLSIPFPISLLPNIYFEVHMGERPPGMSWLYLEPRR